MKILTIVGTRPQFLKLAPLSKTFEKNKINHVVVHTGQHYDKEMSDNLFKVLNIKEPDYLLEKKGKTNILCLGDMMNKIEEICLKEKPDKLIVFGDCDTTIAGAIVARKLKIYLIHIEAGMRSYNKDMPEEINRLMTDHISDLLLCSTQDSVEKLKAENITNNVHYVGNLQLELLKNVCDTYKDTTNLNENNLNENNFALMTIHREYNTNKEMLEKIFLELEKLDIDIVFPIHPRTKNIININNINIPKNLKLINPVDYLNMTILERNCKFIITDSGGVQPEAWYLGKKCIIMRSETEWIEPLKNNNNILYDYKTPLNIFIEDFSKVDIKQKEIENFISSEIILDLIRDLFNKDKRLYIPLGLACKTSTLLKKLDLRSCSLPFDYLNVDLNIILKELMNNLSNLRNKDKFYYNEETETFGHKDYGRKVFMHYTKFDKFNQYCRRFMYILKNLHNVTFVTSFIITNSDSDIKNINYFKDIREYLLTINPLYQFRLILIQNNNKVSYNNDDKDIYIYNVIEPIKGATHIPNELLSQEMKSILLNQLHIVYTKFMIITKDFLDKGYTKEKVFSEDNMIPRIKNFEKYYINWVHSQINKNFLVVLIIDKDLPINYLNMLQNIIKNIKNIILIKYNYETLSYNSLISNFSLDENKELNDNKIDFIKTHFKLNLINYKKDFDINYDYIITTRIDDDDLISDWYIDYLQKNSISVDDFKLYGGNNGYVLLDNKIYDCNLHKLDNTGLQSIGLTLIQKTNNNIKAYFNIFSFPHHICIKNLPNYNNHTHLFNSSPNINNNNIKNFYHKLNERFFIYNRNVSCSVYEFENLKLATDIKGFQIKL